MKTRFIAHWVALIGFRWLWSALIAKYEYAKRSTWKCIVAAFWWKMHSSSSFLVHWLCICAKRRDGIFMDKWLSDKFSWAQIISGQLKKVGKKRKLVVVCSYFGQNVMVNIEEAARLNCSLQILCMVDTIIHDGSNNYYQRSRQMAKKYNSNWYLILSWR